MQLMPRVTDPGEGQLSTQTKCYPLGLSAEPGSLVPRGDIRALRAMLVTAKSCKRGWTQIRGAFRSEGRDSTSWDDPPSWLGSCGPNPLSGALLGCQNQILQPEQGWDTLGAVGVGGRETHPWGLLMLWCLCVGNGPHSSLGPHSLRSVLVP